MEIELQKTWMGYEICIPHPDNPQRHLWVGKVYRGKYTWVDDFTYAKKFTLETAKKHKKEIERIYGSISVD